MAFYLNLQNPIVVGKDFVINDIPEALHNFIYNVQRLRRFLAGVYVPKMPRHNAQM